MNDMTPEQINELVGEMESLADFAPVPSGGLRTVLARALTAIRQLQEAQPIAIAIVEENDVDGDPFLAKVRWIFNPMPIGAELYEVIQTKEQGS